jgi:hypothetical protein
MVIRIDKKDKCNIKLVNARPCHGCLEMMKSIGIRRVYYSDDYGNIIHENVKDMVSIHASHVMMKYDNINKTHLTDQQKKDYWDQIIKNKIPQVIKETSFNIFINNDFNIIKTNYKLIIIKIDHIKKVDIINMKNVVVKTILLV